MPTLKSRLAELLCNGEFDLPMPGAGATASRHHALAQFGATDLSLARLAEAHTDAIAILSEAGKTVRPETLYGVWASDAAPSRVTCERLSDDEWRIDGIKQFCTGTGLVGAALVTAHHADGVQLFDVPVDENTVIAQPSQWKNPAFADTGTTAVQFQCAVVQARFRIGETGWYLSRPGFWHGSIGPAACWAGGARSLIEATTRLARRDAHSRAQLGALQATAWGLNAILEHAGREIDADPRDTTATARTRGLKVRHLVERACTEVLDRFGRATGPQLLAYDSTVVRQHAALTLYIRQCHAERDLETIPE